jgi:hypothetical protein
MPMLIRSMLNGRSMNSVSIQYFIGRRPFRWRTPALSLSESVRSP